jgi:hypothetical protein
VRFLGSNLGAGRQQGSQVIDDVDLVFADQARQEAHVEQVAFHVRGERPQFSWQRMQIHG